MATWSEIIIEASRLCDDYCWPAEAMIVRETETFPDGFGRQVGQAVALFASVPPLGGLVQSHEAYRESRRTDAIHAKRLARLRELVAVINNANRRTEAGGPVDPDGRPYNVVGPVDPDGRPYNAETRKNI